jgi:hypothetical protein
VDVDGASRESRQLHWRALFCWGGDTTSRVGQAKEVAIELSHGGIQLQEEDAVWWNDYFGEMSHAVIWFAYNNDTQPWRAQVKKLSGGTANDSLNWSAYIPPAAQRQYVGDVSTASDMDLPAHEVEYHVWPLRQGATQCEGTPPPVN